MIRAEVVHNLYSDYPAAKAFERVVLILEELGLSLHQVIIILTPVADGTHISINTKIEETIDPETAAEIWDNATKLITDPLRSITD